MWPTERKGGGAVLRERGEEETKPGQGGEGARQRSDGKEGEGRVEKDWRRMYCSGGS